MHQIYLWHATKFDWIPLWSTEKGFLLMNLDILKYDYVNYDKFTNANWIKTHSVKTRIDKNIITTI